MAGAGAGQNIALGLLVILARDLEVNNGIGRRATTRQPVVAAMMRARIDLNISEIPAVLFPCLSATPQVNLMLKPRP
jgi:hypothetical protein